MSRRAVVTGMGAITPLGNTVEEFWQNLLAGKSSVQIVDRFDISDFSTQIAAQVRDFDPSLWIEKKELKRRDLVQQYSLASAVQAIDDSGLDLDTVDHDNVGVIVASGIGGILTFEEQHARLLRAGPGRVSPFFIPMMIVNMCAGLISMRYGFHGPNYAVVSACASAAHAILDATRIIQRGEADVMVCGGAEAAITPTSLAGFCQAKAMSTRNDAPEVASRPFDKDRDGFVMGEGAATVVLEEYEHAVRRGAKIYGEVLGGGMSGDAYHVTAPHPEGHGAIRSMAMALKDSGVEPQQIDYINTHGTATYLGDLSETRGIKKVLGDHAYKIPCNSTKSMTGHLLGAAGAAELVVVLKSIQDDVVHATINLDEPGEGCDLDYVPNEKRACKINYALSNSFGFGGHNVTLVIGRVNSTP